LRQARKNTLRRPGKKSTSGNIEELNRTTKACFGAHTYALPGALVNSIAARRRDERGILLIARAFRQPRNAMQTKGSIVALHHAKPGEVVDLRPLGNKLKNEKTAAIIKTESFEAVRLVVLAGKEIPSHEVSGNITLHCLEGRILLGLAQSSVELNAGQWVYLDGGEAHSVKGIEDSSLLLTILFDR
jgi:quercetin dioxygenase-like cupin family protein